MPLPTQDFMVHTNEYWIHIVRRRQHGPIQALSPQGYTGNCLGTWDRFTLVPQEAADALLDEWDYVSPDCTRSVECDIDMICRLATGFAKTRAGATPHWTTYMGFETTSDSDHPDRDRTVV